MSSVSAEDVVAACAELEAAFDKVLGLSTDALMHPELVVVLGRMERIVRRAPAAAHPIHQPAGRRSVTAGVGRQVVGRCVVHRVADLQERGHPADR